MEGFVLLRNIEVENANAIAGQTWGFPAITNFLGFSHALERKLASLSNEGFQLKITGCAVICHELDVQSYQSNNTAEHVFALTRNPLTKDEKSPAFVEEGRLRMKVSLILGVKELDLDEEDTEELEQIIHKLAQRQRLAGGLITKIQKARVVELAEGSIEQTRQVNVWLRTLLPGYALVARPELLNEHSKAFSGNESPELAAWLDNSTLHLEADRTIQSKPYSGWIRPIVVGYRAISDLYQPGEVAKSRDNQSPVCFVEYAYSFGEWLSPHRINKFEQILWSYQSQPEQGWYLCQNDYEQFLSDQIEQ